MEKRWMLVVDIEASGPYITENFMPELGAVCFEFTFTGEKEPRMRQVAAFSSVMKAPFGTTWDAETIRCFWEKKPGDRIGENLFDSIQRRMRDSGEVPEVAMERFTQWLRELLEYYGHSLIIASDNPAVDIAWINYYLRRYGNSEGLPQLLQHYAGEYRRILDTSSWRLGVRQYSPWISREQWMLHIRPSLSEGAVVQSRTHQALADAVDVATSAWDVLKYLYRVTIGTQTTTTVTRVHSKSWAAVASSPPSQAPLHYHRPALPPQSPPPLPSHHSHVHSQHPRVH